MLIPLSIRFSQMIAFLIHLNRFISFFPVVFPLAWIQLQHFSAENEIPFHRTSTYNGNDAISGEHERECVRYKQTQKCVSLSQMHKIMLCSLMQNGSRLWHQMDGCMEIEIGKRENKIHIDTEWYTFFTQAKFMSNSQSGAKEYMCFNSSLFFQHTFFPFQNIPECKWNWIKKILFSFHSITKRSMSHQHIYTANSKVKDSKSDIFHSFLCCCCCFSITCKYHCRY